MTRHDPVTPSLRLSAVSAARLTPALQAPARPPALVSDALAGSLIIVGASVRTMIPMCWLALGGNVCFIVYGLVHPGLLMVARHAVLLPVNLFRGVQVVRLTQRVVTGCRAPPTRVCSPCECSLSCAAAVLLPAA